MSYQTPVRSIWKNIGRRSQSSKYKHVAVHATDAIPGLFKNRSINWEDLQCVIPGKMATSMLLDVWFRELMRHWRDEADPLQKKVVILDCRFYNSPAAGSLMTGGRVDALMQQHTIQTVDKDNERGLLGFDMIIVPIHCPERLHWELGIVDIQRKRFEYYDTLCSRSGRERCQQFATHMANFLREYAKNIKVDYIPLFQVWTRRYNVGVFGEPIPRQPDMVSCGFSIASIIEQRVLEQEPIREAALETRTRITRHLTDKWYSGM